MSEKSELKPHPDLGKSLDYDALGEEVEKYPLGGHRGRAIPEPGKWVILCDPNGEGRTDTPDPNEGEQVLFYHFDHFHVGTFSEGEFVANGGDGHMADDVEAWMRLPSIAQIRAAEAEPDLTVGPEPAQGDRERARQWGFNNSLLESQIVDLAAEFARVRAEATKAERERCANEIERRRIMNTEATENQSMGATVRTAYAYAGQELAIVRDAIRGSK